MMEIGAQSPKTKRKVANLNTSPSGLLGTLNDCGENIPVEGAAAQDQGASRQKRKQRQECYQAKSKNSVTIHDSSPKLEFNGRDPLLRVPVGNPTGDLEHRAPTKKVPLKRLSKSDKDLRGLQPGNRVQVSTDINPHRAHRC